LDADVTCLLPVDGTVMVGVAGAHLVRLTGAGLAERVGSFDDVPGRDRWYTPWGGPPDTRSLAAAHGVVYANVHVGGIARSRDGGHSWEPTIDVDADVHQVLAADERVLAACGDE